jgi:hypothetical protein
MKLIKLALAAGLPLAALGAAGAASAQDWHHGNRWDRGDRWHHGDRWDRGDRWHHGDRWARDGRWRDRGWGYARHCRIVWRHHYRQRVCWR